MDGWMDGWMDRVSGVWGFGGLGFGFFRKKNRKKLADDRDRDRFFFDDS